MATVEYVSGGARSGKSSFALERALRFDKRAYLATAEPFDGEMQSRIKRHQEERGSQFITIEEPLDIASAINGMASSVEVILVDCLTVWANNLLYYKKSVTMDLPEIQSFLALLKDPPTSLVIVSNELGMGIVPADALSREYRDLAGFINQAVAALSTKATFMVSGLPITLK